MKHRLASLAAAATLVALVLPGIVAAANTQVVAGKVIGTLGTLMVASSNQMTVYTFDKDVAGSGVSNCSGDCLVHWPALTIAAGATPTGDSTVTGTLGTITRTDASSGSAAAIQVTYNGLPLYFFFKDAKPGDANGIYPGWKAVVLAAATPTQVVEGKVIAKHGTLLVASANQMTVYTFDKDVANSGVSTCTGTGPNDCLTHWPALTITPGGTPTAGAGVTGKLGTITRADNGALQITYDGLPLYFFFKDAAPGDANGIYPGWKAVVLAAEATPTPAPTATPQAATPPPTSTSPTGTGSTNDSDQVPALLFAGIAVLGFVVAARRLAAIRA